MVGLQPRWRHGSSARATIRSTCGQQNPTNLSAGHCQALPSVRSVPAAVSPDGHLDCDSRRQQPIRYRSVAEQHRRVRPHDFDRLRRSGLRTCVATRWQGHRSRRRQRQHGADLERTDGRARRPNAHGTGPADKHVVVQPGRTTPRGPRLGLRSLDMELVGEHTSDDRPSRRRRLRGTRSQFSADGQAADHCGAAAHIRRRRRGGDKDRQRLRRLGCP